MILNIFCMKKRSGKIIFLSFLFFVGGMFLFYKMQVYNLEKENLTQILEEKEDRVSGVKKIREEKEVIEDNEKSAVDSDKEEEVEMEEGKDKEELNGERERISVYSDKIPEQIVRCNYKLEGIPSPKAVSFNADGSEIWTTSLMNKRRGVAIFDTETGGHKKDIFLNGGGGVEIVFNKDGSRAYVSQMETGKIFEIDTKLKEVLRELRTESAWTKVVTLSGDENLLFASNWSGNNVSVIDLDNGLLLYNIPVVETPRGIYATNDGENLYVAGFKNGEIEVINLETRESRVIYRNGGAMRDIIGDEENGFLYVSDMANASIYRVNIETDSVEKFVDTEQNPNTIEFAEDKEVLVVSNRGINNKESYHLPGPEWGVLQFFNTEDGVMLDAVIGGNQPTGLSVYQDKLGYSNFLDGNIIICNMPTYQDFLRGNGGASRLYKDFIKK